MLILLLLLTSKVGDILKIHKNEDIPCDMVVLSTSDQSAQSTCFITTTNIDGETDIKLLFISPPFSRDPLALSSRIVCPLFSSVILCSFVRQKTRTPPLLMVFFNSSHPSDPSVYHQHEAWELL